MGVWPGVNVSVWSVRPWVWVWRGEEGGYAARLGGADGAELEAVAAVGEGRGAVAVLGRDGEGRHVAGRGVDRLLERRVVGGGLLVAHGREEVGECLAQVGGDDGGRGLHGAEAEVVAGRRDGHAQQVGVHVDGADDRGHEHGEDLLRSRRRGQLLGVEEVDAVGGAEGEVVVLAGAVDAREGLLVEEAGEAVLARDLLHELHHHQVLVDLARGQPKVGRHLILIGRDCSNQGSKRTSGRSREVSIRSSIAQVPGSIFGSAPSRWRVLSGMPIRKASCWISLMQARAAWLGGAM